MSENDKLLTVHPIKKNNNLTDFTVENGITTLKKGFTTEDSYYFTKLLKLTTFSEEMIERIIHREDNNDLLDLLTAQSILVNFADNNGLGLVRLVLDGDDFYPPTFYIKAPSSLNPEESLILSEKIFDYLYKYYEKHEKLEDMNKFFFRLDFEEKGHVFRS